MTRDLMLTIPGGVLEAVKLPPDAVEGELLQELAIALYERKVLSLGKA